eukprot:m.60931 g.60931  ORF g.60931 m.60931 type:complete len:143 (-) comp11362_c0_seq2:44-472(-)
MSLILFDSVKKPLEEHESAATLFDNEINPLMEDMLPVPRESVYYTKATACRPCLGGVLANFHDPLVDRTGDHGSLIGNMTGDANVQLNAKVCAEECLSMPSCVAFAFKSAERGCYFYESSDSIEAAIEEGSAFYSMSEDCQL